MMKFNVEITDTFGGEANYSWVSRYQVEASSILGAVHKISREHGAGWRKEYDTGDMARYNLHGACVCMFVEYADD